ncbi:hypothetical protein D3C74_91460 [compost metagenome]
MFKIDFKAGDSAETLAQLLDEAIVTGENGEYGYEVLLKQWPNETVNVTWNGEIVGTVVIQHSEDSVKVVSFTSE